MRAARAESVQTYARIAGVVFLIALIAGGFGEGYAPIVLVDTSNASTAASNVVHNDLLIRLGFVGYMVEGITDVGLTFLLYVLLRPVHANLAFLAVLLRLMATVTFAFAELFYFAPTRRRAPTPATRGSRDAELAVHPRASGPRFSSRA